MSTLNHKRKRALTKRICVYCGKVATTKDHVPPKLLLEKPFPLNLQTVRSCQRCNQGASLDEQYFLVLLGQISTSPNIAAKIDIGGVIDRTLVHSPALEDSLIQALEVDEMSGRIFIRHDAERMNKVVKKIAIGLYVMRYGLIPSADKINFVNLYLYQSQNQKFLSYFIATFTERFTSKQWCTTQAGVFSYIFIRDPKDNTKLVCIMNIHQTLWGIVHFPNPKSIAKNSNQQLQLFTDCQ